MTPINLRSHNTSLEPASIRSSSLERTRPAVDEGRTTSKKTTSALLKSGTNTTVKSGSALKEAAKTPGKGVQAYAIVRGILGGLIATAFWPITGLIGLKERVFGDKKLGKMLMDGPIGVIRSSYKIYTGETKLEGGDLDAGGGVGIFG